MLLRNKDATYMDLSYELRDPDDWKVGTLRMLDCPLNITTIAIEPISKLLAVGTADGVIYVFGRPGVETKLTLPESIGVRFLQFAASSFQLVCIDEKSILHVWTLSSYGRPKLVISTRFDPTNSLTISPSHHHAFLALNSGEIRTYDLLCLRKSPYTMPNMWKLYEDKMFARGIPNIRSPTSRIPVEAIIHPRKLGNLFVGYGGGVILADLEKRDTIRAYELVLPPGSSSHKNLEHITQRRPEVTALSIHPSGHFFAVGYTDGSLAFWAVDTEDTPLLVSTLDAFNDNTADKEQLDQHISQSEIMTRPIEREPIFKLTWSGFSNSTDPRGGKTMLAVLGGLNVGGAPGLTVILLPPFNPSESPKPSPPDMPDPFMHAAMRESLNPLKSYFYFTQDVVQDYLLIPQQNPHFSGSFDPTAIILLTEGSSGTRAVEAYQYPPPVLALALDLPETLPATTAAQSEDSGTIADELASTLQTLNATDNPQRLTLPVPLLHGSIGLLGGQLLKLERDIYQTLIRQRSGDPSFPLKGGSAWADESKAANLKLAKHQPNRILIIHCRDLTIRFHDVSPQLLVGLKPTPIQHSFPDPLDHLTIDLKPVLMDSFVVKRMSSTFLEHAVIDSVHFATEALETAVVLKTGELMMYRLSDARHPVQYREVPDDELIILEHVPSPRRFSPYFMFSPGLGPVEAWAASDIGFVAAAYSGAIFIINLRGPEVILRHIEEKRRKSRHAISRHLDHSEADSVTSLVWTVSSLAKDPQLRVRLVALHMSGAYDIYTIIKSGPTWICQGPVSAEGGVANPLPRGSFVIDSKSGHRWPADRTRLGAATSTPPDGVISTPGVLVMVGAKGARCIANINGERIGKTEWGSKVGAIQAVQIVENLRSHVLVVATERYEGLVYSLPHLEFLQSLKLPVVSSSSITLDESGDFIAWVCHPSARSIQQAIYGTLFDMRRAYELPDIDFAGTKPTVPPQPQPVSMGPASMLQLGSWFPFNQSMTGDQLDDLLGGPDRPIPQPESQPWGFPDKSSDIAASASGIAAAAAATRSNLHDRLTSALGERGQMLGDLGARFNELEEGSKSMVTQAKRLAIQKTARSWFGM